MSTAEEPRERHQKPWVTITVAVSTALVTGLLGVVNTAIKTRDANKRSDAGYEATKRAFELLQEQQQEHAKQEAALIDHVRQLEGRPAAAPAPAITGRRHQVQPVQPRAALPSISSPAAQRRIEFRPTLDDVVDAKAGDRAWLVREVYEGPPEGAPQWTKDIDRAAAAETK